VQNGPQLVAARRQLVHRRGGRRRQLRLLDDPAGLEILEPGGEDIRADPGQPVDEIGVAPRALQQLAHDKQRPPLTDETERVGDWAVLVVALHLLHNLQWTLAFSKQMV